jgi:hypothetical protein
MGEHEGDIRNSQRSFTILKRHVYPHPLLKALEESSRIWRREVSGI